MKRFLLAVAMLAVALPAFGQGFNAKQLRLDQKEAPAVLNPDANTMVEVQQGGVRKYYRYGGNVLIRYVVTNVNLKTVAQTVFPAITNSTLGANFVVTQMVVEHTAVTGGSTGATVSFGSTANGSANLFTAAALTTTPAVGSVQVLAPLSNGLRIASGDTPTFNVTIAGASTTDVGTISFIGYWE